MAAKLVVLGFEGAGTAAGMLDTINEMQQRGVLKLEDAVVASREAATETVKLDDAGMTMRQGYTPDVEIKQTKNKRGRRAAGGAGVGLLAGLMLGLPVAGLAIGALALGMRDKGINDKFIKQVSDQLKPDSSALFLLVSEADPEAVKKEMAPHKATVLYTTLPPETEAELRSTLSSEQ